MKSEQAIIQALHKTGGNITLSAQMLGMARRSLYERIEKSPALQEAVATEREVLLDIAERNVRKAILEGSMDDTWKVLRTLGKTRGYSEKQEVDISAEEAVRIIFDKPIEGKI